MKQQQLLLAALVVVGSILGSTIATVAYLTARSNPEPTVATASAPVTSPQPSQDQATQGQLTQSQSTQGQLTQAQLTQAQSPEAQPTAQSTPTPPSVTAPTVPPVSPRPASSSTGPSASAKQSAKPSAKPSESASSFLQFRLRLLDAVQRRDAAFVRSLVTLQTQWSWGGTISLDTYKISDANAPFWQHLEKAVVAGCAAETQFRIPNQEPGSNLWNCPDLRPMQPSTYGESAIRIRGDSVNIRSGPGMDYPVIATASNEALQRDWQTYQKGNFQAEAFKLNAWSPIILPNGQRGFVQNRYAFHEPTDYRAIFVRSRGQWRFHAFLPGNGN
ncbi:SH3 domain-containing protein [Leptolyngbya sp. FACHB-261]|uniref:SH3 domain-containing protein n=1 Tax=Leptolyngbya sp. FACHB-261 TaxID=2692806 RepID=UPI0016840402|nr:SH3 domain-containing protein [Leptolyngbya sp. FACHB-261]MBD2102183.1 hypothetical protein [Leptolyngbya sp. FACHB-261]